MPPIHFLQVEPPVSDITHTCYAQSWNMPAVFAAVFTKGFFFLVGAMAVAAGLRYTAVTSSGECSDNNLSQPMPNQVSSYLSLSLSLWQTRPSN